MLVVALGIAPPVLIGMPAIVPDSEVMVIDDGMPVMDDMDGISVMVAMSWLDISWLDMADSIGIEVVNEVVIEVGIEVK